MENTDLVQALRTALANTFGMYFNAHAFHWNVEGLLFDQYHEFFGDLYKELNDAADDTAEKIRTLDAFAPMTIDEMYSACTLMPISPMTSTVVREMLVSLSRDNDAVIAAFNTVVSIANALGNQGIANFAAGRIDTHAKLGWKLKSSAKGA